MHLDIAETLGGYIAHPSEYSRLFADIMVTYKPANTVILDVKGIENLYIYNKRICKLRYKTYGNCCQLLQCEHNLFNRYHIIYITVSYGMYHDIFYNNTLYEFTNLRLKWIYDWQNEREISYEISD